MTEDEEDAQARQALATARQAGEPAARAARRAVRRYLLATGVAFGLAVLGGGLADRWIGAVGTRATVTGLLWGALVGAALGLAGSAPVRALPARRLTFTIAVVSALLVGATMGVGPEFAAAYPIGALAVFGAWALGAAWAGRPAGADPADGAARADR